MTSMMDIRIASYLDHWIAERRKLIAKHTHQMERWTPERGGILWRYLHAQKLRQRYEGELEVLQELKARAM